VRELAPQLDLRQAIEVEGLLLAADPPAAGPGPARPDPSTRRPQGPRGRISRVRGWGGRRSASRTRRACWAGRRGAGELSWGGWRIVAWALPCCTALGWLGSELDVLPNLAWAIPLAVQVVLVVATARAVARLYRKLRSPGDKLLRYEDLFAAVERLQPKASLLRTLVEKTRVDGAPPSLQLARLGRALASLQPASSRSSTCGEPAVPVGPALGERARALAGALGDAPARVVRGGGHAGGALEPRGPGLREPRLGLAGRRRGAGAPGRRGPGHTAAAALRAAWTTTSTGEPGTVLLVTGSNMAGKTTLLRAMGANAVLAQAAVRSARGRWRCRRCRSPPACASRTRWARGLSFFYAELERLKAVLELCRARPCLVLLDEVLQGTNTAERQAASGPSCAGWWSWAPSAASPRTIWG
jgi:hypothetical protein